MSVQPKVTKQSHTRQQVLDLIESLGVGTAIPSERQLSADLGVSRLTRRRGMTPESRTLSMTTTHAGARLGRFLNVSPSEQIVVVKRLRLADGETMAIETLHIPEALVPGLTPKGLTGSFYELLRDRYGVTIAGGTQAIEPTVTND
jgi:GntR family transcriptional regulator